MSEREIRHKSKRKGRAPRPPVSELPAELGIVPICSEGETFVVAGADGVVRSFGPPELRPLTLLALAGGNLDALGEWFPPPGRSGQAFDAMALAATIVRGCRVRGARDRFDVIRGPGTWPSPDGPVRHCGDRVFATGKIVESGRFVGDHYYVRGAPTAVPAEHAATAAAGAELLAILRGFALADPDSDGEVLAGTLAAGLVAGLLPDAVPNVVISGPSNAGKSTLLDVLEAGFGGASWRSDDASTASFRTNLAERFAFIPALLDEAERKGDEARQRDLADAARGMTSPAGFRLFRHKERAVIRGMLIFAAIEPPIGGQADENRSVAVALTEAPRDIDAVESVPAQIERVRALAPAFLRRMLDAWPRYGEAASTLRGAMLAAGCTARAASTWVPIVACGHLLLHDGPVSATAAGRWAEHVKAVTEGASALGAGEEILGHLTGIQVGDWVGGNRIRLGVRIVAARDGDRDALAYIRRYGLSIFQPWSDDRPWIRLLVVADGHPELEAIFRGTRWTGRGWRIPLEQLARRRGIPERTASPVSFGAGAMKRRGTLVDISDLPAAEEWDEARPESGGKP